MKIHVIATTTVLLLGFYVDLNLTDWLIVLILFGMVMGAELMNTAVEKICDILRDTYKLPYEGSRDIRDIAAGAVWIQAIVAAIIGILIFSKYF